MFRYCMFSPSLLLMTRAETGCLFSLVWVRHLTIPDLMDPCVGFVNIFIYFTNFWHLRSLSVL